MIKISNLKILITPDVSYEDVLNKLKYRLVKITGISEKTLHYEILKRYIDCRKKPENYMVFEVAVDCPKGFNEKSLLGKKTKEDITLYHQTEYVFPYENLNLPDRPVIVGSGPAGLFCGLYLARAGARPIILERGAQVTERMQDLDRLNDEGILNPDSNCQFGEGGAGTFSDGKLNTVVKDPSGLNRAVLKTFVEFGADESVLFDAKPHIGTDRLCRIIPAIRKEIESLGGEIRFHSKVTRKFKGED